MPNNLTDQIWTGILRVFGFSPDATTAEVDQKIAETPSIESVQAAANEAAEEKYKGKIETLSAQITDLEAQLSNPERANLVESLTERVQSLESENATLAGQIKTKEIQVSALSKDLAASKALYRPKDQPADPTIPQVATEEKTIKVGDSTVKQTERGTELSGDAWDQIAANAKKK